MTQLSSGNTATTSRLLSSWVWSSLVSLLVLAGEIGSVVSSTPVSSESSSSNKPPSVSTLWPIGSVTNLSMTATLLVITSSLLSLLSVKDTTTSITNSLRTTAMLSNGINMTLPSGLSGSGSNSVSPTIS